MLSADAEKVFLATNEEISFAHNRAGVGVFTDLVLGQDIELRTWFHDGHDSAVGEEVNEAICRQERCAVASLQALHPEALSRLGDEATGDTVVGYDNEVRPDRNRTWNVGAALGGLPCDVRFRDVS